MYQERLEEQKKRWRGGNGWVDNWGGCQRVCEEREREREKVKRECTLLGTWAGGFSGAAGQAGTYWVGR